MDTERSLMRHKALWEESLYKDLITEAYFSSRKIKHTPPTIKQRARYYVMVIINRIADTFMVLIGKKMAVREEEYYD